MSQVEDNCYLCLYAAVYHVIEFSGHNAGADPARVQRVHLHPLGFGNGCNAPVLKKTKGLRDFKFACFIVLILVKSYKIVSPKV